MAVKDTLSSLIALNKLSFGRNVVFLWNKLFLESLWEKIIEGYNNKEDFVFSQEFSEAVVLAEYITNCNLDHLHHLLSIQDGVEPFRPFEKFDIQDGRPLHKSPEEKVSRRKGRMTRKQIEKILMKLEMPLE